MTFKHTYVLVWYKPSLLIRLDYTQPIGTQDLMMNSSYEVWPSDSIAEIDAKVIELGLVDTEGLVTPH